MGSSDRTSEFHCQPCVSWEMDACQQETLPPCLLSWAALCSAVVLELPPLRPQPFIVQTARCQDDLWLLRLLVFLWGSWSYFLFFESVNTPSAAHKEAWLASRMHCQMQASSFPDLAASWISWVCLVLQSVPTGHPVLGPPSSLHTSKREHVILSCGWKLSLYLRSHTKIWFPSGLMLWLCLCQVTFFPLFPFHGQVLLGFWEHLSPWWPWSSSSPWHWGSASWDPRAVTDWYLPCLCPGSHPSLPMPTHAGRLGQDAGLSKPVGSHVVCLWRVPVFLWSGFPKNVGGREEVFAAGECLTVGRLRGAGHRGLSLWMKLARPRREESVCALVISMFCL